MRLVLERRWCSQISARVWGQWRRQRSSRYMWFVRRNWRWGWVHRQTCHVEGMGWWWLISKGCCSKGQCEWINRKWCHVRGKCRWCWVSRLASWDRSQSLSSEEDLSSWSCWWSGTAGGVPSVLLSATLPPPSSNRAPTRMAPPLLLLH